MTPSPSGSSSPCRQTHVALSHRCPRRRQKHFNGPATAPSRERGSEGGYSQSRLLKRTVLVARETKANGWTRNGERFGRSCDDSRTRTAATSVGCALGQANVSRCFARLPKHCGHGRGGHTGGSKGLRLGVEVWKKMYDICSAVRSADDARGRLSSLWRWDLGCSGDYWQKQRTGHRRKTQRQAGGSQQNSKHHSARHM